MPRILYRHILGELLRLLVTTTAVVVVVLSFFFAVKPISDGLLSPAAILRVIFFTMPGMLPIALPFAATLASTLVFFRMSNDNEITACAAGGISHRSLLAPVAALGVVLTVLMFGLSNWVVPKFWGLIEKELERDIVRLVVGQIQRGEVIEWGDHVVYADAVEARVPEAQGPGPHPYSRLILEGVAVGRVPEEGKGMGADYTARQAVVDLYRDEDQGRIFATLMLVEAAINNPDNNTLVSVERQPINAIEVPVPFQQNPQFLSLPDLRRLAREPQRSPAVREGMKKLRIELARRNLLEQARTALQNDAEGLTLNDARGLRYRIAAPQVEPAGKRFILQSQGDRHVVIKTQRGGRPVDLVAERAVVELARQEVSDEPRLALELESVRVVDPALPTPSRLNRLRLPPLRTADSTLKALADASLAELVTETDRWKKDEDVQWLKRHVLALVAVVERQVRGQMHARSATAVQCILVLLLGAVMSMLLRQQPPLAIFFWCFMPTIIAFMMVHQGQSMLEGRKVEPLVGTLVTWGGNLLLATFVLSVFLRLRRN